MRWKPDNPRKFFPMSLHSPLFLLMVSNWCTLSTWTVMSRKRSGSRESMAQTLSKSRPEKTLALPPGLLMVSKFRIWFRPMPVTKDIWLPAMAIASRRLHRSPGKSRRSSGLWIKKRFTKVCITAESLLFGGLVAMERIPESYWTMLRRWKPIPTESIYLALLRPVQKPDSTRYRFLNKNYSHCCRE